MNSVDRTVDQAMSAVEQLSEEGLSFMRACGDPNVVASFLNKVVSLWPEEARAIALTKFETRSRTLFHNIPRPKSFNAERDKCFDFRWLLTASCLDNAQICSLFKFVAINTGSCALAVEFALASQSLPDAYAIELIRTLVASAAAGQHFKTFKHKNASADGYGFGYSRHGWPANIDADDVASASKKLDEQSDSIAGLLSDAQLVEAFPEEEMLAAEIAFYNRDIPKLHEKLEGLKAEHAQLKQE